MKIKKITIENFRGIDKLTLDFVHPAGKTLDLVVLAGPNGCGKTSVLEACLIRCGRQDLLGEKATSESNSRIGSKGYTIVADFEGPGGEEITNPFPSTPINSAPAHPFVPIEYFSSWRAPKLVGSVSVTAGKREKRPKATETNRLMIIKQYLVNLTARKVFENYENSAQKEANKDSDAFTKINEAWKLFYPERYQHFLVRPVSESIEEGFDLFLHDKYGKISPPAPRITPLGIVDPLGMETEIPVDALSSGEIEILTMLGWFAIHDFSQGILFIDEPELHLHSAWHRVIMRALRTVLPTTQIICATHSLEIIDSVYSYERFTLLPEDDPRIRLVKSFKS